MRCYETKIINRSGEVDLQVAANHLSDFAAIRAARRLCRECDCAEVWRGDVCVYSECPKKPIGLAWSVISGKA
jgi:hypothetical protein